MKVLFVVHRYAPFPGGSEYYVQNMAEEMLKRQHEVFVLAHEHQGEYNGVKVSNDYQQVLNQRWDLIVVHGGDCISQNIIHANAGPLLENKQNVLYLIVKPSDSPICVNGLRQHRFLGYSTSMDVEHLRKYDVEEKGRRIRHGIPPLQYMRAKKDYDKLTFVSAGGFWEHKAMTPLAEAFTKANIPNAELHLYGYGEQHLMPTDTHNVKCFFGKSKTDILFAIGEADAYILNSYEEGFGLVLLEAMMNRTPWYARAIAGAKDMCYYGTTYQNEQELMELLRNYEYNDCQVEDAYNYVMCNHTIQDTCNDIEDVLLETLR
jgi:glycosyltransferase involved in cell wall biosynthesis